MLRGSEHFFEAWRSLLRSALTSGPVLDLGTPAPFHKEMGLFREEMPSPYFAVDVVPHAEIDVVSNGAALPFATGSMGAVLCSHVLEHVPEPARVIDEVHRTVRPGGAAYFTFPDLWPYHAQPGGYCDYHRFKRDAVEMLLQGWDDITILAGGGLVHALLNYIPPRAAKLAQRAANSLDRRMSTTTTSVYYAVARK